MHFFAFLFSINLKKIWVGQFQIVLNTTQEPSKIALMERFGQLSQPNNLRTEVGILESPSVLMPIYEFVLSNKEADLEVKNMNFKSGKEFKC